jgi:Fe-S-cluster-containing hydrogenase component 2
MRRWTVPSLKRLMPHPEKCTGCGTCMTTCSLTFFKRDDPERSCIRIGGDEAGRTITVCDQECRLCEAECPARAISVSKQGVVTINRKLCIGCLACVAACPVSAMMHVAGDLNPFKCVACGACAKKCPAGAIEIVTEEA